MGARILMDFHLRYADRVATLTLCDCFPSFDTSLTPEKREEFIELRQKPLLEGKSLEDIAPVIIESLVGPNCSEEARGLLMDNMLAIHVPSYLKTLAATFRYDRSASLKDITQPVCLIFGEHDRLTPPTIGEEMLQALPNAELHVINDAGHLSNIEAPDAFNKILFRFLKSHQGRADKLDVTSS
jgi:3-oxoadipate enol-lactonase